MVVRAGCEHAKALGCAANSSAVALPNLQKVLSFVSLRWLRDQPNSGEMESFINY